MKAMLRATPALAAMLLVALAGSSACSQDKGVDASTSGGSPGFFSPQPHGDASIHADTMSATTRGPFPAQPQQSPSQPQVSIDPAQAAQIALERERLIDEEADRVEAQNQRAREQSARGTSTINGAFTGLTDERNR